MFGDSEWYVSPSTYYVGDIAVGATVTRDFVITPTTGGAAGSFDFLATGIVDNSTVSPWISTTGVSSFSVDSAVTVYAPTADPIGVSVGVVDSGVPASPVIEVPFVVTFNISNLDLGVGYRVYTPSDWVGVVLSLTSLVNCTISDTSISVGTLGFGSTSGSIQVTVTPIAVGAYSFNYMASGTVAGAVTNPWNTNGGVPITLGGTAINIPVDIIGTGGTGGGDSGWVDMQPV